MWLQQTRHIFLLSKLVFKVRIWLDFASPCGLSVLLAPGVQWRKRHFSTCLFMCHHCCMSCRLLWPMFFLFFGKLKEKKQKVRIWLQCAYLKSRVILWVKFKFLSSFNLFVFVTMRMKAYQTLFKISYSCKLKKKVVYTEHWTWTCFSTVLSLCG